MAAAKKTEIASAGTWGDVPLYSIDKFPHLLGKRASGGTREPNVEHAAIRVNGRYWRADVRHGGDYLIAEADPSKDGSEIAWASSPTILQRLVQPLIDAMAESATGNDRDRRHDLDTLREVVFRCNSMCLVPSPVKYQDALFDSFAIWDMLCIDLAEQVQLSMRTDGNGRKWLVLNDQLRLMAVPAFMKGEEGLYQLDEMIKMAERSWSNFTGLAPLRPDDKTPASYKLLLPFCNRTSLTMGWPYKVTRQKVGDLERFGTMATDGHMAIFVEKMLEYTELAGPPYRASGPSPHIFNIGSVRPGVSLGPYVKVRIDDLKTAIAEANELRKDPDFPTDKGKKLPAAVRIGGQHFAASLLGRIANLPWGGEKQGKKTERHVSIGLPIEEQDGEPAMAPILVEGEVLPEEEPAPGWSKQPMSAWIVLMPLRGAESRWYARLAGASPEAARWSPSQLERYRQLVMEEKRAAEEKADEQWAAREAAREAEKKRQEAEAESRRRADRIVTKLREVVEARAYQARKEADKMPAVAGREHVLAVYERIAEHLDSSELEVNGRGEGSPYFAGLMATLRAEWASKVANARAAIEDTRKEEAEKQEINRAIAAGEVSTLTLAVYIPENDDSERDYLADLLPGGVRLDDVKHPSLPDFYVISRAAVGEEAYADIRAEVSRRKLWHREWQSADRAGRERAEQEILAKQSEEQAKKDARAAALVARARTIAGAPSSGPLRRGAPDGREVRVVLDRAISLDDGSAEVSVLLDDDGAVMMDEQGKLVITLRGRERDMGAGIMLSQTSAVALRVMVKSDDKIDVAEHVVVVEGPTPGGDVRIASDIIAKISLPADSKGIRWKERDVPLIYEGGVMSASQVVKEMCAIAIGAEHESHLLLEVPIPVVGFMPYVDEKEPHLYVEYAHSATAPRVVVGNSERYFFAYADVGEGAREVMNADIAYDVDKDGDPEDPETAVAAIVAAYKSASATASTPYLVESSMGDMRPAAARLAEEAEIEEAEERYGLAPMRGPNAHAARLKRARVYARIDEMQQAGDPMASVLESAALRTTTPAGWMAFAMPSVPAPAPPPAPEPPAPPAPAGPSPALVEAEADMRTQIAIGLDEVRSMGEARSTEKWAHQARKSAVSYDEQAEKARPENAAVWRRMAEHAREMAAQADALATSQKAARRAELAQQRAEEAAIVPEVASDDEEARVAAMLDRKKAEQVLYADDLRARAARLRAEAEAIEARNKKLGEVMMGTPILIGHHSEKRHRRDLDKIHVSEGKRFELLEEAKRLEGRAALITRVDAPIKATDPDAIDLLRHKIRLLRARQADWQREVEAVRQIFRKVKDPDERRRQVAARDDISSEMRRALDHFTNHYKRTPRLESASFYQAIRAAQARLHSIVERAAKGPRPAERYGAVRIFEEEGRVQIAFPARTDKPTYEALRSRGFKWSPTRSAFVRQANDSAWLAAEQIARQATGIAEPEIEPSAASAALVESYPELAPEAEPAPEAEAEGETEAEAEPPPPPPPAPVPEEPEEPAPDSVAEIMAKQDRERAAFERARAEGVIEFESTYRPGSYAAILRDASRPGFWRLSRYEKGAGFTGHMDAADEAQASKEAFLQGYRIPAPGSVDAVHAELYTPEPLPEPEPMPKPEPEAPSPPPPPPTPAAPSAESPLYRTIDRQLGTGGSEYVSPGRDDIVVVVSPIGSPAGEWRLTATGRDWANAATLLSRKQAIEELIRTGFTVHAPGALAKLMAPPAPPAPPPAPPPTPQPSAPEPDAELLRRAAMPRGASWEMPRDVLFPPRGPLSELQGDRWTLRPGSAELMLRGGAPVLTGDVEIGDEQGDAVVHARKAGAIGLKWISTIGPCQAVLVLKDGQWSGKSIYRAVTDKAGKIVSLATHDIAPSADPLAALLAQIRREQSTMAQLRLAVPAGFCIAQIRSGYAPSSERAVLLAPDASAQNGLLVLTTPDRELRLAWASPSRIEAALYPVRVIKDVRKLGKAVGSRAGAPAEAARFLAELAAL